MKNSCYKTNIINKEVKNGRYIRIKHQKDRKEFNVEAQKVCIRVVSDL